MPPDNPIKHSDLIEPGNPFDKAIKGLEEMIKLYEKLLKNISKSAKEQIDVLKNLNATTKEGQATMRGAAKETVRLTAAEKEAKKIKEALEREQAKLNAMNSVEYKQLLKTREASRILNTELRRTVREKEMGIKSTNAWTKALGSFQFKFNALGNMAAMVAQRIAQTIKKWVTGSLEAYDKEIKAERALLVAMEGRIGATGRLIEQAKQLQKITLFGDEDTVRAQSLIAAFVDEERAIKRIIPLVQDFATAKQMDLSSAADLVAKTLGSSTNAMARYGISVEGAVGSTERLESLVQGLTKAFGGQAEAAALVDSNFTQLKNRISDYQESVGGFFADEILMLRLSLGLLNKHEGAWGTVGVAEGLAAKKFLEYKREIEGGRRSSEIIEEIKNKSNDLETAYVDAVKAAETVRKADSDAAWLHAVAVGDEWKAYRTLIPEVEYYANSLLPKIAEVIKSIPTLDAETIFEGWDKFESLPLIKTIGEDIASSIADDPFDESIFDGWLDFSPDPQITEEAKAVTRQFRQWAIDEFKRSEEEQTRIAREQAAKRNQIITSSFALASEAVSTFSNLYASQKAKELSMVGDNAKKREAIERKYAKKEQQLAIISAIISTAQGVARAFADYPWPYSLIPAAIVAGLGGAQIATISDQEFAEGGSGLLGDKGGRLQGRSHARGGVNLGEIGEAERGEYFGIINKQMARKYSGELPAIFDSLNNGAFHEVWGRQPQSGDPYTKKMYELMRKTPQVVQPGARIEIYPDGRRREIRV